MLRSIGSDLDERTMRRQILTFLEEYCRGMTLADVREWYVDALADATPPVSISDAALS